LNKACSYTDIFCLVFLDRRMRQALSFFVLLLVVAAVEASADITRTVIVMRHCVRTTPFTLDGEILSNFNDYSSLPFPEWKYPAWQCVPRGLDLIATQGAYLREKQPLAQPLIKVVSDAIDRDIDTSHFLLQGLGEPSFPVVADGAIFDAQQGGVCPPDPVEWNDEMILLRLSQAPIPHHHRQLLNSLQAKLGRGIAPSFTNISDSANVSTFVGGSAVAAEIAGYFEMAAGSGIDMSWANVTADDVRNMLPLIVYQHNVWMRALPLAQHGHSNLLAHVLRDLDPVSPSGTSFYVGHDRCVLAFCILLHVSHLCDRTLKLEQRHRWLG
jgi:hypothetical protein